MKARLQVLACVIMAMVAGAVLAGAIQAQEKADLALPEYKTVAGVSGPLTSIGSDTMKLPMTAWTEAFTKLYPDVKAKIEAKGSATGPPALLAGTALFAPMSRAMKAREVADIRSKFGHPPVALPTCIDMIALYVHRDNPIKGMTLQEIDAVFSRTRKGGHARALNTWGDLGLEGEWAAKPITLHGRDSVSGTHQFFREHSLFNGSFRAEVKEQPESSHVVKAIAADKYAIGYSSAGYKTAEVRALPLRLDSQSEYVAAEPANAYSGDYPLARFLLLYVNYRPGTELDPVRREFIRYLYSQDGQAVVLRGGYLPVSRTTATRALTSVGLAPGN
jgi:phosphate transport system substrate-binding protein